jgi:hypothetical protein
MPEPPQCRMLLKSGERCRNRAKKRGICGVHRRALNERKGRIEVLITTGKIAAAATALLKLGEWLISVYPKVAPTVELIYHRLIVTPHRASSAGDEMDFIPRQTAIKIYAAIEDSALHEEFRRLVLKEREMVFFELRREFGD